MKHVFLTGASSGIGHAIALEYAAKGAHLYVAARREKELTSLVSRIEKSGGSATAVPLDVSDPAAVLAALKAADKASGGLDVVIANAGVGTGDHAKSFEWNEVEKQLAVNVVGAIATVTHAIPLMKKRGRGHLVAVTSLAGRRGLPVGGVYSATKAAVSVYMESLRSALASDGIRVTDVQPGFVETPMTAKNTFKMPFKWTAEQAAKYIVKKLERAPAIIAFPIPLDAATRLLGVLPNVAFDPIARRAAKQNR
ncbi:MAG: SDR family NAD(P)-dependent oxidoreductase [Polyangiaceae bacterium]